MRHRDRTSIWSKARCMAPFSTSTSLSTLRGSRCAGDAVRFDVALLAVRCCDESAPYGWPRREVPSTTEGSFSLLLPPREPVPWFAAATAGSVGGEMISKSQDGARLACAGIIPRSMVVAKGREGGLKESRGSRAKGRAAREGQTRTVGLDLRRQRWQRPINESQSKTYLTMFYPDGRKMYAMANGRLTPPKASSALRGRRIRTTRDAYCDNLNIMDAIHWACETVSHSKAASRGLPSIAIIGVNRRQELVFKVRIPMLWS